MGVPGGEEPLVQAGQDQPGAAGQGQPPAAQVRPGVDLDLDAAVPDGVGGGAGRGDPVPKSDDPQPTPGEVGTVPEIAAQVPGPVLGRQQGIVPGQNGGEGEAWGQGGGEGGQADVGVWPTNSSMECTIPAMACFLPYT